MLVYPLAFAPEGLGAVRHRLAASFAGLWVKEPFWRQGEHLDIGLFIGLKAHV